MTIITYKLPKVMKHLFYIIFDVIFGICCCRCRPSVVSDSAHIDAPAWLFPSGFSAEHRVGYISFSMQQRVKRGSLSVSARLGDHGLQPVRPSSMGFSSKVDWECYCLLTHWYLKRNKHLGKI